MTPCHVVVTDEPCVEDQGKDSIDSNIGDLRCNVPRREPLAEELHRSTKVWRRCLVGRAMELQIKQGYGREDHCVEVKCISG